MLDFGLAQLPSPSPEVKMRAGTPAYMAPEQATSGEASPRSDQYSFCVALHEAVWGARPGGADLDGRKARAKVPRWLRLIIERGLKTDPGQRFSDMGELLDALARHRRRRWPRRALFAGGLFLALAAGALLQSYRIASRRSPCAEAAAPFLSDWDEPRQRAVAAAFTRSERSFARASFERVDQGLSAYTRALATMSEEACVARRVQKQQSEAVHKLRRDCLSRRRQEVQSLTELLSTADAKLVEDSIKLVALLPAVATCADVAQLELLPPLAARSEPGAQALFAELATALTLRKAGRYDDGMVVAERAVAAAQKLGVRALTAEALEERGRLQKQRKKIAEAAADFRAALLEAEASRHDLAAARLWIELLSMTGFWQNKPQEARPLVPFARAAVERVGQPTELQGALTSAMGLVELAAGDTTQALALQEQALALYEKAYGATHLKLIEPLIAIGQTRQERAEGDGEETLKVLRRAHDITQAAVGPEHPLRAVALGNLAVGYLQVNNYQEAYDNAYRGLELIDRIAPSAKYQQATLLQVLSNVRSDTLRYDEALPFAERGARLAEELFGAESPQMLNNISGLALILANIGRAEEARRLAQRTLDIAHKSYGAEHPKRLEKRNLVAAILRMSGDARAALALLQGAVKPAAAGPEHKLEAYRARMEYGLSLLALGQREAARPALEEAQAGIGKDLDESMRSALLFALAQVLPESQKTQAIALAEEARKLLENFSGTYKDRRSAQISAWLANAQRVGASR